MTEQRDAEVTRSEENPPALTVDEVASTSIPDLRVLLPGWLSVHAVPEHAAATIERVRRAMDRHSDDELRTALDRYRDLATEFRYYPADEVARSIGKDFVRDMALESTLTGVERLRAALKAGPCLLLCNHLSYADSQFTDLLLASNGADDLARRLVFVAGPKVYESPTRRMAALGLNTLPTLQSTRLGRGSLSPREVAKIALGTVKQAGDLMRDGQAIVLYAEGTRSRTGRMCSFLRAANRYAGAAEASIVPMALAGSNRSFPIHEQAMRPAHVSLSIGEAVEVEASDRQAAVEEAWHRIAALLPDDYKPEPDTPPLA